MTVGYNDADHTIEREFFTPAAGGAATTVYGKFRSFRAAKVLRVKAVVATAGTAVGHGFDIYNGTTSIATIPLGTSTAGVVVSDDVNSDLAAGDLFSVKSLADIVGKADIMYEYRRTD